MNHITYFLGSPTSHRNLFTWRPLQRSVRKESTDSSNGTKIISKRKLKYCYKGKIFDPYLFFLFSLFLSHIHICTNKFQVD